MIKSILLDFVTIKDAPEPGQANGGHQIDLVDQIVIKYFQQSLIDLSQDRVVNVRVSLAECFQCLQVRMEELETEALRIQKQLNALRLKGREISKKDLHYLEKFQELTNKLNGYLNRQLFFVVRNLKNDKSFCVAEFMEGIEINEPLWQESVGISQDNNES